MSHALDITDQGLLFVVRGRPILYPSVLTWLHAHADTWVIRTHYDSHCMMRYHILFTQEADRVAFKLRWWGVHTPT